MTETGNENPEADEGLVFHEGSRLTDLKIKQNLSVDYPRLEPLHHLKIELMFHIFKIRSTWTIAHWSTLAVGFLAVTLSGWDLGVNELASGGDFYNVGLKGEEGGWLGSDSGIKNVSPAAFILTLLTLILWVVLLVCLWSLFPLMRSQAISLYVALIAAEISQYQAHGTYHKGVGSALVLAGVGILLITFVCFILQRAVTETRDVHVEERHWHPDPRQVELAKRDHSLIAWTFALFAYCFVAVIHAWSGAYYVSARIPSEETGWVFLKMLYMISGFILVWLMMHVLWYPQIMLGGAQIRIESDRARLVGVLRRTGGELPTQQPSRSGKCPDCGEVTNVQMRANGDVEATCSVDGCNGNGSPGDKCQVCGTRISSRIICNACNTSAPVGNHFTDDEAW